MVYLFRYHVPRSWLYPRGNLLVIFEEWGGNPAGISLVKREIHSVCGDMYEWQPTLMNYQMQASGKVHKPLRPKVHLSCVAGQKMISIKFASFGTPEGTCGSFSQGNCHAHNSYDAFEKVIKLPFCTILCEMITYFRSVVVSFDGAQCETVYKCFYSQRDKP